MGTSKVENLETKGKENEETMNEKLKNINDDIGKVEVRVTNKIMAEIEPSLGVMKDEIQTSIGTDLRRLVQEEVTLQRLKEAKERDEAGSNTDGPERNKNTKIQKKYKTINTKNIESSREEPEDGQTSSDDATEE